MRSRRKDTMEHLTTITVIDAIMGAGKTTYAIDYMNRQDTQNHADRFAGLPGDRKFLYVTPILTEVARVQDACQPLQFRDPAPVHGSKFYHLGRLVEEGQNVATTHRLFSMLSQAIYRDLRKQNYTLVIDEVLTCCDHFTDMSRSDKDLLFDGGFVYIEEKTSRLRWNHDRHADYRGRFDQVRNLCDNGNLVAYVPKNAAKRDALVILWQFPSEFLQCFSRVVVLTYLFHGSPMKSYLEAEGLNFDMQSVGPGGTLVPWGENSERATKEKLRQLVTIYDGRLNAVGKSVGKTNPLSSSWFKRATLTDYAKLRQATISFFKHHAGTPSALNAWTTFKDRRAKLKGTRYGRDDNWVPLNAKATNDYIEKRSLAYLANRFSLPLLKGYFEDRGITVNDDVYALSEMVQWLWRSGIRRGDPVSVYVPSDRMRRLLKLWLDCDDTLSFVEAVGGQSARPMTRTPMVQLGHDLEISQ